jgi:proliferating cell nuclear antigen
MLIARLKNKELMTVLQATKVPRYEASFIAKDNGIYYRMIDYSHISLLDIVIPKEAYQYYSCEGESNNIVFTVKPDELLKVLKRIDKDETVEITVDGEDITIRSISVRKPLTYKTKSLSNEYEKTKLPNITYAVKVNIQHNALKEALEDLYLLTDTVRIITDREKVRFNAVNEKDEEMTIEYEHNRQAVMIYMLDGKAECKCVYSIPALLSMLKAVETKYVALQYNERMPLRLQFLLPFKCEMHYYLAPRVED